MADFIIRAYKAIDHKSSITLPDGTKLPHVDVFGADTPDEAEAQVVRLQDPRYEYIHVYYEWDV